MKILAIGAAWKMGRAVVSYFATDPEAEVLGLMDVQENILLSFLREDTTVKLKGHLIDANHIGEMKEVMSRYDAGIITLPNRKLDYQVKIFDQGKGITAVQVPAGSTLTPLRSRAII